MYTIELDGKLLYAPTLQQTDAYKVITPRLKLQTDSKAGSLSFTLPPGHVLRGQIEPLKSMVKVFRDEEEIFCGRVLEEKRDFHNQAEFYCEGELSFLIDSIQRPYTFSGSPEGFLALMLETHNAQVDEDKRFSLGRVTGAPGASLNLEGITYTDTMTEIETVLLNVYGGHLRVRREGGVRYLDYLDKYEDVCAQPIEFSVNLLDVDDKRDAKDIFSVLIPLGAVLEDGSVLTVNAVNNGLDYIEDADLIGKYGRIYQVRTFSQISYAEPLLAAGRRALEAVKSSGTIKAKAIDMHILDGSAPPICIGQIVPLVSAPHGLQRDALCTEIDLYLEAPEKTEYTFGNPPDTQTGTVASANSRLRSYTKTLQYQLRHIKETEFAVNISIQHADEALGRVNNVEVDIDAVQAAILLKADSYTVDELSERMTAAEIDIDGIDASILLKADAVIVDELGTRVSSAEVDIDGLNSEIDMKANRIDLEGYVTADEFSSLESDIASLTSGTVQASHLYTQNLTATNTVRLAGHTCVWRTFDVVKGVSLSKSYVTIPGANGASYVAIGGVDVNESTETLYYLSY